MGTLVGYPLDRIKADLQFSATRGGTQRSVMHSVRCIYSRAGPGGFYAGVTAPLVALAATSSVNFSAYVTFRRLLGAPSGSIAEGRSPDRCTPVAGAAVGPVLALINTPLELVKVQMQAHGGRGGYASVAHASVAIASEGGPRAFYVGYGVNTLREAAFGGTYFTAYEAGESLASSRAGLPVAAAIPLAGGAAGVVAWLCALPFDTVMVNMQSQRMDAPRELTAWRVAASVWRASGVQGFFHGAGPSVLRAFVVNAVRISVYELTLSILRSLRAGPCPGDPAVGAGGR